jgi:hypothetical protein
MAAGKSLNENSAVRCTTPMHAVVTYSRGRVCMQRGGEAGKTSCVARSAALSCSCSSRSPSRSAAQHSGPRANGAHGRLWPKLRRRFAVRMLLGLCSEHYPRAKAVRTGRHGRLNAGTQACTREYAQTTDTGPAQGARHSGQCRVAARRSAPRSCARIMFSQLNKCACERTRGWSGRGRWRRMRRSAEPCLRQPRFGGEAGSGPRSLAGTRTGFLVHCGECGLEGHTNECMLTLTRPAGLAWFRRQTRSSESRSVQVAALCDAETSRS